MTKIIQAFLSGALFTFILDFFLFLGVFLHYIQPLGIEVYYNVLFANNQNIFYYLASTLVLGYLVMYTPYRVKLPIFAATFTLVSSTLVPSVGKNVGEWMFMQKNITLHNKNFTFIGDIYYIGRDKVTLHDKELDKVILLDKKELLENIDEEY